MEAPPSPQSVGREFVRQYYTLLNKAPTHLHRFYNHQSSFVHGGLDPPNRETSPVIGQKQIHQKIQQLNFRDCHAKITQVDSQATLGNGVVVQVTGELSNAGQPMRRFTQTFVLAAQSPKKFYVHNDIFRYQDEIISDEECDDGVHSEPEEEIVVSSTGQGLVEHQQPISQPTILPYYPDPAQLQANIPTVPIHHNQQPPPHVMNPPVPTVNGAIHPDDINVLQGQVPSHVPAPQAQGLANPLPVMQQGLVQSQISQQTPIDEPQAPLMDEIEEPLDNSYTEQEIEQDQEANVIESASNEPKTYANLLKSGSNIPYTSPPSQTSTVSLSQPAVIRAASPPTTGGGYQSAGIRPNSNNSNNRSSGGPRGINQQQQQPQRLPGKQDSGRASMGGGGRSSGNEDGSYEDRRRSQSQNFNDVNQLFLGNLPHTATEDELREIFSEFGNIVDLRVHSKPPKVGGPPGARAPPNYGFITYETQQGVENCLRAKPIYYSKDDKNGTVLNVEEKKTKDRPPYGGGRLMDNNRGGRGDNGGQRRGMGGPGGLNRNSTGGTGGSQGPNNRTNTYSNRSSVGGPPSRGPNTYNRR